MKMITVQLVQETEKSASRVERTFILKDDAEKFDFPSVQIGILEFLQSLRNAGVLSDPPVAPDVVVVPPAPPSMEGPGSSSLQ